MKTLNGLGQSLLLLAPDMIFPHNLISSAVCSRPRPPSLDPDRYQAVEGVDTILVFAGICH